MSKLSLRVIINIFNVLIKFDKIFYKKAIALT